MPIESSPTKSGIFATLTTFKKHNHSLSFSPTKEHVCIDTHGICAKCKETEKRKRYEDWKLKTLDRLIKAEKILKKELNTS